MLRSSRYAKSGIGRFSPVDTSAGVANPPSSPSTAMKSDSRRIESSTASAVTIARRTNVADAGMRFQSVCAAKNVANRIAIAAPSRALAVARVLARRLQLAQHQEHDGHENTDSDADGRLEPALIDRVAQEKDCREHERDAGNPREQLDADQALPVEGWRRRRGANGGFGGGTFPAAATSFSAGTGSGSASGDWSTGTDSSGSVSATGGAGAGAATDGMGSTIGGGAVRGSVVGAH